MCSNAWERVISYIKTLDYIKLMFVIRKRGFSLVKYWNHIPMKKLNFLLYSKTQDRYTLIFNNQGGNVLSIWYQTLNFKVDWKKIKYKLIYIFFKFDSSAVQLIDMIREKNIIAFPKNFKIQNQAFIECSSLFL